MRLRFSRAGGWSYGPLGLDKGRLATRKRSWCGGPGRIEAYLRPVPGSQAITYQDVALLAHHFGVSYRAATYRLRSLNLVSQQEGNALLNREQAGNDSLGLLKMLDDLEKTENQERQDRELKTQVVHLALEAYRHKEISRGKCSTSSDWNCLGLVRRIGGSG